jgi:hypothetical protein
MSAPNAPSIFTFWLVLATFGLAIVAVIQIGFLNRAERISANIAQAAKDSAEAANQAVILSDKTAGRQLRAFVFISRAEISDIMSDQKLTAKIVVKNFGQTPAYDVGTSIRVHTTPFPLIMELNTNIGPGGDITLNFNARRGSLKHGA